MRPSLALLLQTPRTNSSSNVSPSRPHLLPSTHRLFFSSRIRPPPQHTTPTPHHHPSPPPPPPPHRTAEASAVEPARVSIAAAHRKTLSSSSRRKRASSTRQTRQTAARSVPNTSTPIAASDRLDPQQSRRDRHLAAASESALPVEFRS